MHGECETYINNSYAPDYYRETHHAPCLEWIPAESDLRVWLHKARRHFHNPRQQNAFSWTLKLDFPPRESYIFPTFSSTPVFHVNRQTGILLCSWDVTCCVGIKTDLHTATPGAHPRENPRAISACDIHAF